MVVGIVVGVGGAPEHAFISRIIRIRVAVGEALPHASPVTPVRERVNAVGHALVSIVGGEVR